MVKLGFPVTSFTGAVSSSSCGDSGDGDEEENGDNEEVSVAGICLSAFVVLLVSLYTNCAPNTGEDCMQTASKLCFAGNADESPRND